MQPIQKTAPPSLAAGAEVHSDLDRPVLSDGTLKLIPFQLEHAADLHAAAAASAEALRTWMGGAGQPAESIEEAQWYIAQQVLNWNDGSAYYFMAYDAEGAAGIGFLNSFNRIHRFANLGYWIRSDRTGRGYATATTRLLARFGFESLGLHRIEIVVDPQNIASQRVAEKAGAVREGILRNRLLYDEGPRDAVMFSIIPPL